MRKLAVFSFSFAAAAAAYVWLRPGRWALLTGGVLVLAFLLLRFFSGRPALRRVRIAALGLAVGVLWSWGYEARVITPRRTLCGAEVALSATVSDQPVATDYGCRVSARLDEGSILLYLNCPPETLALGDCLTLTADVTDVSGNAAGDSLYYQAKGISLMGMQRGELTVERPEKLPVACWPARCTALLRDRITEIFPEDVAGFVRALLTGDRSGLDYSLNNQLSITGISHVISVSGMHVSLLVGIVMLLTGRSRRLAAMISLPVMYLFAAMLGFDASITRAVIMNSVLLLAPVFRRENDNATSLGLALLLILVFNPWAVAGVSLQLSFASMAGIFWLAPGLYRWLNERLRPVRSALLQRALQSVAVILSASFAASAMTTPLVAYYFGTVSIISPLTNLLTMSVLSAVFSMSFGAVVLSLWKPLGVAAAWLLGWPVRYVLWVVEVFSQVPYGAVYTASPYMVAWLVTVYAMLTAFLRQRKTCRPQIFAGAMALTLLAAILFSAHTSAEVEVTAFDVGQGQCIVLESGGFSAMVDCGGDRGDDNGEYVARQLLMSGRSRVDALVLTHFDTDHVCGAEQLFQRVEIGGLFVPDVEEDSANRTALLLLAEAAGIPVYEVSELTQLRFSGGCLTLLPPEDADRDNASLAALLSVKDYDILITGDMDMNGERYLLRTYTIPDLEVLVAGHHGSRYSTAPDFLAATTPEIVLISVGENSYGHPTAEVLARISACGAAVYRTDLDGTVTVRK